ncbi:hypothetical protein AFCA_007561 [Aspergillus flavus]|uniref:Sporulation associated protein n=1 Tax=Aspergillus flavus TaxID=5059 RepID=A0AB74CMT8_ASPFL|nr:hypothetical protein AFLA_002577 [Aspergillus flavus NRRL3357]KAJ1717560.1 sporulation associated protein [Aspergillus flavus]RAQ46207.1 sporulation associated protein [Aspergillus flavus]RAQ56150.1 sporulation associated protein [Aspergillus flavus]RAQ57406.1 sporulation associated protein [Aspergillus flavus]
MPHATSETDAPGDNPRRIVLCFDGTGNQFQGNESDTNIMKIYQMLDRHAPNQFHYYQPGIGTYVKGQSSSSGLVRFWPKIKSKIISAVDQAVGSSFSDHVLAGYRFLMRYYSEGDHIYIFGFSRGAYTARFLAEMVHELGLLSRGNEEMVHFAWETFSNYEQSRGNVPQTEKDRELNEFMKKFKRTFCRLGVGIHFLGLFDCVNSVGQFEIPFFRTSYRYIATPAAKYIRHAVSIHERRLKFKPALYMMDKNGLNSDFKEVWFAGNHSDVGGGYNLQKGQKHLLSDTPLNWMVQEVLHLEGSESKLEFQTTNVEDVLRAESVFPGKEEPGTNAWEVRRHTNQPHDCLWFGHASAFLMVIFWWILEILPIFTRLELEKGEWVPRRFPPNLGAPRDIPVEAKIHSSVNEMVKAGILDKESIPKKGGDNPNLPNPASVVSTLKRARKSLARPKAPPEDSVAEGPGNDAHKVHENGSMKGIKGVHKGKGVNGVNGVHELNSVNDVNGKGLNGAVES